MRADEFHLLSAECAARLGNDADAKATMINLLDNRIPDAAAVVNPLSGSALQDFIYLQTRIELWGEGKSYLAMKRNQATVTRGSNHVFRAGETFDHDQDELTYDVNLNYEGYTPPQLEFLNCEGMTSEGSLILGEESNFTFYIPYVTSNGTYTNGNSVYDSMSIESDGVLGLTANLEIGSFNQYEGVLEFNVTGTPNDFGSAMFNILIDNKLCIFEFEVSLLENCNDYGTLLTINFDNAPEETYWELYSTSDSSTPIYSGGSNGSYEGLTSVNIPMCLESGDFVLTFYDANGNGMSTDSYIGNYTLTDINGDVYACGGIFSYSETSFFTTGINSQINRVNLDIVFDNYPEETAWQLYSGSDLILQGGVTENNITGYPGESSFSTTFCLESNDYSFVIYDLYSDGICCAYGNGSYILTKDDGTVLASGGSFGANEVTEFTID
jgi:hypothetical protein